MDYESTSAFQILQLSCKSFYCRIYRLFGRDFGSHKGEDVLLPRSLRSFDSDSVNSDHNGFSFSDESLSDAHGFSVSYDDYAVHFYVFYRLPLSVYPDIRGVVRCCVKAVGKNSVCRSRFCFRILLREYCSKLFKFSEQSFVTSYEHSAVTFILLRLPHVELQNLKISSEIHYGVKYLWQYHRVYDVPFKLDLHTHFHTV